MYYLIVLSSEPPLIRSRGRQKIFRENEANRTQIERKICDKKTMVRPTATILALPCSQCPHESPDLPVRRHVLHLLALFRNQSSRRRRLRDGQAQRRGPHAELLPVLLVGQEGGVYDHFTLVNYNSRVILTINLPILRL